MKKKVLVTGAGGFIGSKICNAMAPEYNLTGVDIDFSPEGFEKWEWLRCNLTDWEQTSSIVKKYKPDVVIHAAGIAHQKLRHAPGRERYNLVNTLATLNLAKVAAAANSHVHFIFLSTISVYGEKNQGKAITEESPCNPSSDYAVSKLNAEGGLKKMFNDGLINRIDILRLAPVYDQGWTLNIDKRVFGPGRLFYIRYGKGDQTLSVLARENLVSFIKFILTRDPGACRLETINVCDRDPVSFNEIIYSFKSYSQKKMKITLSIPLWLVGMVIRIASLLMRNNRELIRSYYPKLSRSLVFGNQRMLETGFIHRVTLKDVFSKIRGQ